MLAKELAPVLTAKHEVLALDHASCDIGDEAALREKFMDWHPELVVNCAAYPDVDGCERDPERAFTVNSRGAGNVARVAEAISARVFHISTDYVFDGQKRLPYEEQDATNPISVYGKSKLEGEKQVFERDGAATRHLILRTSWLYGIHRANFVEKILADAHSLPHLEFVADQVSCPTWTYHLAHKIAELTQTRATGILHVAGSGQCSRYELACYVVGKISSPVPVSPITWAELKRPARRPAYSALGSQRLVELGLAPLPHWKEALDQYLALRWGVPAATSGT